MSDPQLTCPKCGKPSGVDASFVEAARKRGWSSAINANCGCSLILADFEALSGTDDRPILLSAALERVARAMYNAQHDQGQDPVKDANLRSIVELALRALPSPPLVEAALRPEVAAFAQIMEQQLRANDHKPGWKNDAAVDLLHRVRDEVAELGAALMDDAGGDVVAREAADVANFAMMIADVWGGLAYRAAKEADDAE